MQGLPGDAHPPVTAAKHTATTAAQPYAVAKYASPFHKQRQTQRDLARRASLVGLTSLASCRHTEGL